MRIGEIKNIHNYIYVFLLLGIVASMPLSKWITSLFQFLLVIHWLIRGDYAGKWQRLKSRPSIWILSLFLIIPAIGMLYTSNWEYGLHDLKIKAPLLVLPLLIGTSEIISRNQLKLILLTFTASVTVSSMVSLGIVTGIIPYEYSDIRETSLFISHIRLALLVDMSVFILSFYALRSGLKKWERLGLFTWALYLLGFLVAVKAMTGIVVGFLVGLLLTVRWLLKQNNALLKRGTLAAVFLVPILVGVYINKHVNDFYDIKEDLVHLDRKTAEGNLYWHDTTNLQLENGFYIGLYVCEKEIRKAWNEVSTLDYDGKDVKNQDIRFTLIRYMTSLGLRKDAEGVHKLNPDDIKLIEDGYANYIYKKKNHFNVRMYELIWEIDVYKKGGNPSGHSVTQRIEYLRTGLSILKDHPLFGVGTGDVPKAFDKKYEETQSPLDPEWRLRAHNQWLTFGISFGLLGALILFLAFIAPGILQNKFRQYLFLLFFMVSFLSMFNEDTLETQAGVAFFAFFYPFLLFSPHHDE